MRISGRGGRNEEECREEVAKARFPRLFFEGCGMEDSPTWFAFGTVCQCVKKVKNGVGRQFCKWRIWGGTWFPLWAPTAKVTPIKAVGFVWFVAIALWTRFLFFFFFFVQMNICLALHPPARLLPSMLQRSHEVWNLKKKILYFFNI